MHNLDRFIKAQEYGYARALSEMQSGGKRSHWIWYIFPQLDGLGRSELAKEYGISGWQEALAYLDHPVLGARLREISKVVLSHLYTRPVVQLMGSEIDAMKLRSCMTLFDFISPRDVFGDILARGFGGKYCNFTRKMLNLERVDVEAIRQWAIKRWTLGKTHGVLHWDKVRSNVFRLRAPGVNRLVVECFAYLHDCCRVDDLEDPDHGPRAAEFITQLRDNMLKGLNDEEFRMLQDACRLHTTEHRTGNPTIDACFDADRLDLVRIQITPDPNQMATEIGARLARMISDRK